jgi:hypothetical protein
MASIPDWYNGCFVDNIPELYNGCIQTSIPFYGKMAFWAPPYLTGIMSR